MSKFGTKNALFGYFGARILKSYWNIWNQHPRISQIAKFYEKMKIPKFGNKNVLFGIFGMEFKTILSYLKSALSNLSDWKISWNNENA